MRKLAFPRNLLPHPEEPYIQREIDSDDTGTIRRYLRLADVVLKKDDDSKIRAKSNAA